jgi:CubicO group peptidase (beta-lactamase class C family)
MHKAAIGIAACFWLLMWPQFSVASQAEAWSGSWPLASPESQGFNSTRLQSFSTDLMARGTTGFLVIRNEKIVFEVYAPGYNRTKPHGTASLAKALVGGTSLMLLLDDGKIKPDDLVSKYIPEWANDPLKSQIRIRHLATHTSGIEDAELNDIPHDQLTGWKGDFWKRLPPPHDPFTIARDIAPVMERPGTHERYSNPGMAMLSYCLTIALRDSANVNLRDLLKHRVLDPLGVPDSEWSVGYNGPINVGGVPIIASWGGASYSPNATARIGRLLLHHGNWDGHKLISGDTVRLATSNVGMPNHSGLAWWVNRQLGGALYWKALPADAFWGAGAGHQLLLVVPSLNLIVVRNGSVLDAKLGYSEALEKCLITPLMGCLATSHAEAKPAQTEYPPSPVIREIVWAPKDTIVRKANDSDNWPLTWADDDALYTAYGDGYGFEPHIPEKLSLGFAKVLGYPPDFSGINLRSPTGEQRGGGSRARKASGLLMVEGVLYLWARNATNSQLACSTDHGATWTWSNWKFDRSFGYPTFLNFGRNYGGTRDDFAYVFSPDADSAYVAADRVILARVPKRQILNRDAYEFFQSVNNSGEPLWSKDLAQRGAVFNRPGGCYRPSVSFDPALKRYFLVMPLPNQKSRDERGKIDTRSAGGLAIYDAPEPWGPWTTVFQTEDWDTGPGDAANFPEKWMSQDGKVLQLVFSGDDNFSVRQATLVLRDPSQ